jgi:hypothetical protein
MRKWYMDLEKVITLTHSKFTHSIINWLLLIFLFKAFSDVFGKLILKVE